MKIYVMLIMSMLLITTFVSAYQVGDVKVVKSEVRIKGNDRVSINSDSSVDVKPKKTSGGGCITQWAYTGTEWVKRDLVNPHNGKIIEGHWCIAFDMNERKVVSKPQISGLFISDNTPLPTTWANYRNKHLW